jgi:DNA-binding transcriptional LysR family regulator
MSMATALNFRTLDLNLLRVFDVVMAERNLTRAAERLSLTQPAVSNALKRLKEAVGEELLTRAAGGVKPTPLSPGEFNPQADATSFRIAMADATAALFMPPLVSQIEDNEALVDVRVLPLTTRDPAGMLERGDADLAVGYFPATVSAITGQGSDSALRYARLHESAYVCVMREGHPLADTELTLDAYCAAHHLLMSFSGRPHGLVDQALTALNRKRRIFTAGRVVAHSDLLAVMPAYFVGATGYREKVVTRPLPFHLDGLQVGMVWHMRNDRSSSHQWLRARLLEAAAAKSGEV